MLARYTLLSVGTLLAGHLAAQSYCAPTFPNGCFNWRNLSIEVGSSTWEYDGVDCSTGDHTATVMTVDAGSATPMVVTNGVWCGCAVWVDMDQSNSFEAEENLYHSYVGGAPSHTYNFDLEVPVSVPTGSYRMRIVAGWGSDGFTEGSQNGFGPCGDYQYGNYTDLTLNVIGASQVQEVAAEGLWVGPNPGEEQLRIQVPQGLRSLQVLAMDGRMVTELGSNAAPWLEVDMRGWPTGSYVVRAITGAGVLQARWVKQ
ncbi:MAG: T9SS type A sorting domain-containing protein [Flavobacteriales bacterium]